MTKGKIIAGISAAALAGGIALATVPAHATEPDGVETVQVTAYDTSPTGTTNSYHYHPVATCPDGYVATGGGWADSMVDFSAVTTGNDGPTTDGLGWQGHALYFQNTRTDIGITVACALGTTS